VGIYLGGSLVQMNGIWTRVGQMQVDYAHEAVICYIGLQKDLRAYSSGKPPVYQTCAQLHTITPWISLTNPYDAPQADQFHWVLAVIDLENLSLDFYDSMGNSDRSALVRPTVQDNYKSGQTNCGVYVTLTYANSRPH
jgi:hypothetical protein